MSDYLFGLATLPALAAAVWVMWQLARLINRTGEAVMKTLPLGKVDDRAGFASFAACTRRARLFVFGGVGVAVMAGYDGRDARKVYDAVYPVLAKPARINLRRRAAGPQDPGNRLQRPGGLMSEFWLGVLAVFAAVGGLPPGQG